MNCDSVINEDHFKFDWLIHNLYFGLFDEIRSPCFRIPNLKGTSWCISVQSYQFCGRHKVAVYIHRMEGEFEKCNNKVRAKMSLLCSTIHSPNEMVEMDIYECSEDGILVFAMTEPKLLCETPQNRPFRFECTLSVWYSPSAQDNLLSNISSLFPSGDNADLTLILGNKYFSVHKAILFARLPELCSELGIDRDSVATVLVQVDNVSYRVMQCFLNYAYGKVYTKPRLFGNRDALHDASVTYSVYQLHRQMHTWIPYCRIVTNIKVERKWVFMEYGKMMPGDRKYKLLNLMDMRSSPLYIRMKMLHNKDGSEFLKIRFRFPSFRRKAIFMICTIHLTDCLCPSNRIRQFFHTFESNKEWTLELQIPKRDLQNSKKAKEDSVRGVTFDILLSEGDQVSSEERRLNNSTDLMDIGDFRHMSLDLENLLRDADHPFSDVTLIDEDGGRHFAHYAILVARSNIFRIMFNGLSEEEKMNVAFPCPGYLLTNILDVIYTGHLTNKSADDYIWRNLTRARFTQED